MKSINEYTLTECIERLRELPNGTVDDACDAVMLPGVPWIFDVAEELADRIYDLTRWIPVEERLPDDVFDYVHVHYDGMIGTMCYSKEKGFFGATANRMEMFAHAITHWRRIDTPEGV